MLALLLVALWAPACGDCDGAALVQHFECARCHDGLPVPAPPPEKQCLGCHREIRAGRFKAAPDVLAKWQAGLQSLNHVPSLEAIGARFSRAWIARYLVAPSDLRPALPASMPRLEITPAQAERIAGWLAPGDAGPASVGDAARGRARFGALGCGICHRFYTAEPAPGGALPVALSPEALATGMALAPELSVTRERFRADALVPWLRAPSRLKPGTPMPDFALSEVDARDLAAYITSAPLVTPAYGRLARTPAPLDRPVKWAEVEARVFRKICWHCHSDADLAHGDGGPGNTGGFGFAPRGLNLATYQGISSGIRDRETGARRSVFRPAVEGGDPLIVAAMMARHAEVLGSPISGIRGMPLGLPPIPLEDIQRVVTWIAQGRPR